MRQRSSRRSRRFSVAPSPARSTGFAGAGWSRVPTRRQGPRLRSGCTEDRARRSSCIQQQLSPRCRGRAESASVLFRKTDKAGVTAFHITSRLRVRRIAAPGVTLDGRHKLSSDQTRPQTADERFWRRSRRTARCRCRHAAAGAETRAGQRRALKCAAADRSRISSVAFNASRDCLCSAVKRGARSLRPTPRRPVPLGQPSCHISSKSECAQFAQVESQPSSALAQPERQAHRTGLAPAAG